MKPISIVLLGLCLCVSACKDNCDDAKTQIIDPLKTVEKYLLTYPKQEELKQAGCTLILTTLKDLPAGAELVRRAADDVFSAKGRHCVEWERGVQWVYEGGFYHWVEYDRCVRWSYEPVRKPEYETAIELSQKIDEAYKIAQDTCVVAEKDLA
jgi:hypothetical protein